MMGHIFKYILNIVVGSPKILDNSNLLEGGKSLARLMVGPGFEAPAEAKDQPQLKSTSPAVIRLWGLWELPDKLASLY